MTTSRQVRFAAHHPYAAEHGPDLAHPGATGLEHPTRHSYQEDSHRATASQHMPRGFCLEAELGRCWQYDRHFFFFRGGIILASPTEFGVALAASIPKLPI